MELLSNQSSSLAVAARPVAERSRARDADANKAHYSFEAIAARSESSSGGGGAGPPAFASAHTDDGRFDARAPGRGKQRHTESL